MEGTQILVGSVLVLAVAGVVATMMVYRKPPLFEGTFTLGPEISAFVPAGGSPRYWLAWEPGSGFMEGFRAAGFDGVGTVHAAFEGKLETSAKDGYGHMGQYAGQVTVLKLVRMTRTERP